jgi:hypothetical protein
MTDNSEPPRLLFKYRHFDPEGYNLKSLDEIFFSSADSFNDPFDMALPRLYHSSDTSHEKILEYMRKTNPTTNNPPLPDQVIVADWNSFIGKIPSSLEEAQNLDLQMAEKNARETGVYSLTEREDSILMWSHYSKNHTGFMIGYRSNVLYEALRLHAEVLFIPIEYCNECPNVIPYEEGLTLEDWARPSTVKFSDWQYENEWRLVYFNGAKSVIPIPENAVESVHLGLRIAPNDEELIINKLRSRKIKVNLFKAKRQFNSFQLLFDAIEY